MIGSQSLAQLHLAHPAPSRQRQTIVARKAQAHVLHQWADALSTPAALD